ncbi:YjbQ family protein [Pseudenhygromyxa sp. WMMC2535]|uniref:secondary thiamine-phosphate synthase enzyme YjbQ n=1 Tax=Pseudenhygromyxa sp. WMMC2535 TaxID=2712867 RepID=UPI001553BAC0|nr:secondary thiamine-phosphate synthase enzyme YjbQ [Pseudenhygromyxa sp. WMMC2535]NVB40219.1 YjbQ family protein [Pseudenhygromyxa sp. WMMC2535]
MHTWAKTLTIATSGRGTLDISARVQGVVDASGIRLGLCNVFIHHTSASLIVCENADPEVRRDLERFAARLVPDGDPLFRHTEEGPDDMPAHVRSVLTQTAITFPVSGGRVPLGTWQGIYLWEHRHGAHGRKLTITVQGQTRDLP